jgi:anti-sigma-K factor RskA
VLRRRRRRERSDAELAALADGSLPAEQRADIEARVAGSPELMEALAEQQRAVALIRGAALAAETPARLRARVGAQRRPRPSLAAKRLAFVAVPAVAALAGAIALAVSFSRASAERYRVALAATALAPGASGDATVSKTSSGWRITLHATGLRRLAGGRFYEAWLENARGVLVPIGTFNEGTRVTLWSGVSPKSFGALTVTRERADGDQASSKQTVLVGTVRRGASG